MADENSNGAGADQQQQLSIHSIYLKDASFESPSAPGIFQSNAQPNITVNVGINTQQLGDDTHEVTLTVTATAKLAEDKTAFLAEVHQGGVFTLRGFDRDALGQVLGIYCPNMLFPYAREAVANLVTKGGFPPLMLQPVNFEALYAQHLQRQEQEQQAPDRVQ